MDSVAQDGVKPYIIAEIASNFKGDYGLGIKHIEAAAKAGASAVKFQLLDVNQQYHNASSEVRSLHEQLDKCTPAILGKFKVACEANNIDFMCTGTFMTAVDIIDKLNPSYHKIASAQAALFPQYIEAIMKTGRPVICSTGIAEIGDLDRIHYIFNGNNEKNLELLHCRSQYPCPEEDSDLDNINFLRDRYRKRVGYSDHTLGSKTAIVASMLGSRIFEKHFKLDDTIKSPDAESSVNAKEFEDYINDLNWVAEQAQSRKEYRQLSNEEKEYRSLWEVKVFARNTIKRGQLIMQKDLNFARHDDSEVLSAVSIFDKMKMGKCYAGENIGIGTSIKHSDIIDCK